MSGFLQQVSRAAVGLLLPNSEINLGLAIAVIVMSIINALYDLTIVSYYIAAAASQENLLGVIVGGVDNVIVRFGDALKQLNAWIADLLFRWINFEVPKYLLRYLAPVTLLLPRITGYVVDQLVLSIEEGAMLLANEQQRLAELRDAATIAAREASASAAGAWAAIVGGIAGAVLGGPGGLAAGTLIGGVLGSIITGDVDRSPSLEVLRAQREADARKARWRMRAARRRVSLRLLGISAIAASALFVANKFDERFDRHTRETGCQLWEYGKTPSPDTLGFRPNTPCMCGRNQEMERGGFVTRTKPYQQTRADNLVICRTR